MVEADYFDGRSAMRRPVRLSIADGRLLIKGPGVAFDLDLDGVDFGEPNANAPRCIEFASGGRCEVADAAACAAMLASAGMRDSPVVRMQAKWLWALASFLFVIIASTAAYLWGLPAASRELAARVPPALVQTISKQALRQLDEKLLRPSRLPAGRQEEIRDRATAFLSAAEVPWRLHFRESGRLGSNAFALPGGDIVLLDRLVDDLTSEEINAVLAHEVGHLTHRHGMQLLIERATIAVALAAWFGDVSSAAVGAASMLLEGAYSRDAEREADAYAARVLLRCCRSVEPLVSSLEKLERKSPGNGGLLATHPETRQRIAILRAMQP